MRALALIGLLLAQEPDVDALLKQLADESIEVREKATAALVAMGDKAEGRIRRALDQADPSLKMRFERILSSIARDRRLRAVLPALKPVAIAVKDKTVSEVIDDFRKQTGIPVKLDGEANPRITLEVKEATPFDALIAICRAANFSFEPDPFRKRPDGRMDRDQDDTVWLTPDGFCDIPRRTVRHYGVEPVEVTIKRTWAFGSVYSTSQLIIGVRWLPGTKPDYLQIDVASVTDDKGKPLLRPKPHEIDTREDPYLSGEKRPQFEMKKLSLSESSKEARTLIAKGCVIARYAVDEVKATFESPEKLVGASKEVDGLTVTLKSFKSEDRGYPVVVLVEGRRASKPDEAIKSPRLMARLEDGSRFAFNGFCGVVKDNSYSLSGSFNLPPSRIVSLDVILESICHVDKFDFELKDIPLPK